MIGDVVVKTCTCCGAKTAHLIGSRLVSSIGADGRHGEIIDYLSAPQAPCGCINPKEFFMESYGGN